jgi:hypothetical protein
VFTIRGSIFDPKFIETSEELKKGTIIEFELGTYSGSFGIYSTVSKDKYIKLTDNDDYTNEKYVEPINIEAYNVMQEIDASHIEVQRIRKKLSTYDQNYTTIFKTDTTRLIFDPKKTVYHYYEKQNRKTYEMVAFDSELLNLKLQTPKDLDIYPIFTSFTMKHTSKVSHINTEKAIKVVQHQNTIKKKQSDVNDDEKMLAEINKERTENKQKTLEVENAENHQTMMWILIVILVCFTVLFALFYDEEEYTCLYNDEVNYFQYTPDGSINA